MSKRNQMQNEEINLVDFFETLWDEKILISAFVALVTLAGFVYSQVTQPRYKVSIPYTINAYVPTSQLKEVDTMLTVLMSNGWNKDKNSSNLSLLTINPLDLGMYEAQVEVANEELTNEIYADATAELAMIQTELSGALLGTERVATSLLNAKRLIRNINGGHLALTIGSVSILKPSPKVPQILALSVFLGGIMGVFFIIARNAIRERKEQLAKE